MHSALNRAQNVFGFFSSVAVFVAALVAFSVVLSPQSPSGSIKLRNIQVVKGRPHYYSSKKEEYAHIKFDLDTDLSSLFSWNTKQVFVYVTATFPSLKPSEPPSQAIIWDAILGSKFSPEHPNYFINPNDRSTLKRADTTPKAKKGKIFPPGELHLANQRPKYQITDITGKIANRTDAILELNWNVQPWVGALTWTNKRNIGLWKGLDGGASEPFGFPSLKGGKPADLGTMKGGEKNRGKPA